MKKKWLKWLLNNIDLFYGMEMHGLYICLLNAYSNYLEPDGTIWHHCSSFPNLYSPPCLLVKNESGM